MKKKKVDIKKGNQKVDKATGEKIVVYADFKKNNNEKDKK